MWRTGPRAEPALDCVDPFRLAAVDCGDFTGSALDGGEIVGRDSALGLQCRGGHLVDIAERLGCGLAGGDGGGQRFLRRNPAFALRRARPPTAASRVASAGVTGRSLMGRVTGTRGSIASAARGCSDG